MKLSWAVFIFCARGSTSSYAADNGRELYDAACASCHGRDGRGASEGTAIILTLSRRSPTIYSWRKSFGKFIGNFPASLPV